MSLRVSSCLKLALTDLRISTVVFTYIPVSSLSLTLSLLIRTETTLLLWKFSVVQLEQIERSPFNEYGKSQFQDGSSAPAF